MNIETLQPTPERLLINNVVYIPNLVVDVNCFISETPFITAPNTNIFRKSQKVK